MGADQEVYPMEGLHKVKTLTLKRFAIAITRSRMHSYYDKVRFLLGDYHSDVLLDKRYQALELHPAPQSLGKPSGDIGVVISENSYLKAVAFHNRIDREISLSVIITHSVTGQEWYSLRIPYTWPGEDKYEDSGCRHS